ncbi:MAG: hypothetical protein PHC33_04400 [Candidatus Omnitrophica bacterium]|nr:hypothetical protein [Candidatus Omnitrophota bacterium]
MVLKNNKGVLILLVSALSIIICLGIMILLFVLRSNALNMEAFRERAVAYYLCETGASVAILDIGKGRIGTGAGQYTSRTFDYTMGSKTYPINYEVTKSAGQWQVISWVDSSAGFSHRYKLRVGGRRAFPFFIRGFGGK